MGDVWGGDVLKAISRKSSSLVLLSIIAPISILVGFRLSGVLQGQPLTFDTIAADTINYSMIKPEETISDINQTIINQYNDPISLVCLRIRLFEFLKKVPRYNGNDLVSLRITVAANVTSGYIYSFSLRFSQTNTSLLDIREDFDWIQQYNVKVTRIYDPWTGESFVESIGINRPQHGSLTFDVFWVFIDEKSMSKLTITASVLHFNGASYQKYLVPIFLEVS